MFQLAIYSVSETQIVLEGQYYFLRTLLLSEAFHRFILYNWMTILSLRALSCYVPMLLHLG